MTILTTATNLEELLEAKPTARGQVLSRFMGLEFLKTKEETANAVNITVNYYDSASISAATTSGSLAGTITVPAKSNLVILDKTTALYLEENDAIGAIAGTAAKLTVVCSYEDIG